MRHVIVPALILIFTCHTTAAYADQKKSGGDTITVPLDCEHEKERVMKCETKGNPPQKVCEWVWVDKGCAVYNKKPREQKSPNRK
jgi:hypothetical protein